MFTGIMCYEYVSVGHSFILTVTSLSLSLALSSHGALNSRSPLSLCFVSLFPALSSPTERLPQGELGGLEAWAQGADGLGRKRKKSEKKAKAGKNEDAIDGRSHASRNI